MFPAYRRQTAKFCSAACRRTGISRPCAHCGSLVYRSASQVGENVYCSSECSALHSRFRTGQVPWNKDRKGIHLSPASEFKPGARLQSRDAIGTVRLRMDNQGDPRAWVKVAEPNRWMLRAQVVWCEAHGPLPPQHVIHHRDRDKLNDAIQNLECLTKAAHMDEHRAEILASRWPSRRWDSGPFWFQGRPAQLPLWVEVA